MVEQPRHYGYILRGQITGMFKVGITNNVKRRMGSYQTHIPERIIEESVKTFVSKEEAQDWERSILKHFRDCIHHGEWLDISRNYALDIPKNL